MNRTGLVATEFHGGLPVNVLMLRASDGKLRRAWADQSYYFVVLTC